MKVVKRSKICFDKDCRIELARCDLLLKQRKQVADVKKGKINKKVDRKVEKTLRSVPVDENGLKLLITSQRPAATAVWADGTQLRNESKYLGPVAKRRCTLSTSSMSSWVSGNEVFGANATKPKSSVDVRKTPKGKHGQSTLRCNEVMPAKDSQIILDSSSSDSGPEHHRVAKALSSDSEDEEPVARRRFKGIKSKPFVSSSSSSEEEIQSTSKSKVDVKKSAVGFSTLSTSKTPSAQRRRVIETAVSSATSDYEAFVEVKPTSHPPPKEKYNASQSKNWQSAQGSKSVAQSGQKKSTFIATSAPSARSSATRLTVSSSDCEIVDVSKPPPLKETNKGSASGLHQPVFRLKPAELFEAKKSTLTSSSVKQYSSVVPNRAIVSSNDSDDEDRIKRTPQPTVQLMDIGSISKINQADRAKAQLDKEKPKIPQQSVRQPLVRKRVCLSSSSSDSEVAEEEDNRASQPQVKEKNVASVSKMVQPVRAKPVEDAKSNITSQPAQQQRRQVLERRKTVCSLSRETFEEELNKGKSIALISNKRQPGQTKPVSQAPLKVSNQFGSTMMFGMHGQNTKSSAKGIFQYNAPTPMQKMKRIPKKSVRAAGDEDDFYHLDESSDDEFFQEYLTTPEDFPQTQKPSNKVVILSSEPKKQPVDRQPIVFNDAGGKASSSTNNRRAGNDFPSSHGVQAQTMDVEPILSARRARFGPSLNESLTDHLRNSNNGSSRIQSSKAYPPVVLKESLLTNCTVTHLQVPDNSGTPQNIGDRFFTRNVQPVPEPQATANPKPRQWPALAMNSSMLANQNQTVTSQIVQNQMSYNFDKQLNITNPAVAENVKDPPEVQQPPASSITRPKRIPILFDGTSSASSAATASGDDNDFKNKLQSLKEIMDMQKRREPEDLRTYTPRRLFDANELLQPDANAEV